MPTPPNGRWIPSIWARWWCSRRRELKPDDWLDLARDLKACGKNVVLSTLTLIESEADLRRLRRFCEQDEFLVEANDQSALQVAIRNRIPFITGPSMNIYNTATLKILAKQGLKEWNLPVELGKETLEQLIKELHQEGLDLPAEVFSWGFLPLAWSPDALPPVITTCPRTTASSAACSIRMAWN